MKRGNFYIFNLIWLSLLSPAAGGASATPCRQEVAPRPTQEKVTLDGQTYLVVKNFYAEDGLMYGRILLDADGWAHGDQQLYFQDSRFVALAFSADHGKLRGAYRTFYNRSATVTEPAKVRVRTFFVDGREHGEHQYLRPDGSLVYRWNYVHGHLQVPFPEKFSTPATMVYYPVSEKSDGEVDVTLPGHPPPPVEPTRAKTPFIIAR